MRNAIAGVGREHARDVDHESIERPSSLITQSDSPRITSLYGAQSDIRVLQRMLRGDLDRIATTALQRDPARRYATATAFAEDLRRWLDGRPIAARADSAEPITTAATTPRRVSLSTNLIAAILPGSARVIQPSIRQWVRNGYSSGRGSRAKHRPEFAGHLSVWPV